MQPDDKSVLEIFNIYPKVRDPFHTKMEIAKAIDRYPNEDILRLTKTYIKTLEDPKFAVQPIDFFRDDCFLTYKKKKVDMSKYGPDMTGIAQRNQAMVDKWRAEEEAKKVGKL